MSYGIASPEDQQRNRQQLENGKKIVVNTFEQYAREAGVSIKHEWGENLVGDKCSLAIFLNGERFVAKFNWQDLMDACDPFVQARLEKIIKEYWLNR